MLLLLAGFVSLLAIILGGAYSVLGKNRDIGRFDESRDGTLNSLIANIIVLIKRVVVNETSRSSKEHKPAEEQRGSKSSEETLDKEQLESSTEQPALLQSTAMVEPATTKDRVSAGNTEPGTSVTQSQHREPEAEAIYSELGPTSSASSWQRIQFYPRLWLGKRARVVLFGMVEPATTEDRASAGNTEPGTSVTQSQQREPEAEVIHSELGRTSASSWQRILFDPRLWYERRVRVVLLGMTGAGKSTLGNWLVSGEQYPAGGFKIGHGMNSLTTDCQGLTCKSEKCKMTIYDTPGVPDTDKDETLERFNEVVRTVRELPALNGIVFLLDDSRQEANDYDAYRILFGQYTKLPCPLVVVGRVDSSHCPENVQREKEKAALELIERVLKKCNLKSKRVHKFIYRHGDVGEDDANKLRSFLGFMPGVPVAKGTLMTFNEMKQRLSRLSNQDKRVEELKKDVSRLKNIQETLHKQIAELDDRIGKLEEKAKEQNWGTRALLLGIAATADIAALGSLPVFSSLTAAGLGLSFAAIKMQIGELKGTKEIAEGSATLNAEDLAKVREEVSSGKVDPKELENARDEYQELLKLTNR